MLPRNRIHELPTQDDSGFAQFCRTKTCFDTSQFVDIVDLDGELLSFVSRRCGWWETRPGRTCWGPSGSSRRNWQVANCEVAFLMQENGP